MLNVKRRDLRRFFVAFTGSATVVLLWMQGCTRKSEESANARSEAVEIAPPPPAPQPAEAPPSIPSTSSISSIAPRRLPPPPEDVDVLTLERRYQDRKSTEQERDEIVKTIGRDESPQAMITLRRIFDEEKRQDVRMRVLEVVADRTDEASQPLRWEIFSRATEARQPVVIRLSAMATLEDMEDPRVVPLMRALSHDSNATIRENAARILQERKP